MTGLLKTNETLLPLSKLDNASKLKKANKTKKMSTERVLLKATKKNKKPQNIKFN